MYKIEDNVPAPPKLVTGRPFKYPLAILGVGQSFYVPKGDRKTISVCASRVASRLGRTFAVRQVDGGVRAWRIK